MPAWECLLVLVDYPFPQPHPWTPSSRAARIVRGMFLKFYYVLVHIFFGCVEHVIVHDRAGCWTRQRGSTAIDPASADAVLFYRRLETANRLLQGVQLLRRAIDCGYQSFKTGSYSLSLLKLSFRKTVKGDAGTTSKRTSGQRKTQHLPVEMNWEVHHRGRRESVQIQDTLNRDIRFETSEARPSSSMPTLDKHLGSRCQAELLKCGEDLQIAETAGLPTRTLDVSLSWNRMAAAPPCGGARLRRRLRPYTLLPLPWTGNKKRGKRCLFDGKLAQSTVGFPISLFFKTYKTCKSLIMLMWQVWSRYVYKQVHMTQTLLLYLSNNRKFKARQDIKLVQPRVLFVFSWCHTTVM